MSLVSVIEVSAESIYGYDDAARRAVKHAARTLQNFSAVWLKEFEPIVQSDGTARFEVKAKIAFVLHQENATPEAA